MRTKEEICQIISDFYEVLKDAKSDISICSATVNEADKAFGDIRHFCEFNYPTDRKMRTKICRLINEYSKERRVAKDLIDILTPLANGYDNNSINRMGKIVNETKKALAKTEGRAYAPRVLNELFEEEQDGN